MDLNGSWRPELLPSEWDLEIGGAVLFTVEPTAVEVASTPEQHPAREVDEIALHEILPLNEGERRERLTEDALRLLDLPLVVSALGYLVEKIRLV